MVTAPLHKGGADHTMNAIPSQTDARFQSFLSKLLDQPHASAWSEKQQMELEMARELSNGMRELAERMRDEQSSLEQCLVLLKYAKVLDFIMSSLSARREINPQTLRVIFKLAQLPVREAYPE
jgi:hypothetical protein